MHELKIRKVGNSLGTTLPREVLDRLHLKEGAKLYLPGTSDGGDRITPYDPTFEQQMELAEEGLTEYRNALRQLAK